MSTLQKIDLSDWYKCLDALIVAPKESQLYIINCFHANEAQFKRNIIKMSVKTDNSATISNLKERILKVQKALQHPAITVETHEKLSFDLKEYESLLKSLDNGKRN